ncbi:MAG: endonuclease [Bacteroidales bacterium]|nr:endonuclease [Bacteroidales bacterium]
MKDKILIILLVCIIFCGCSVVHKSLSYQREFVVMFYNLENMFDIYDSENNEDSDFTPTGMKNWTHSRYETKKKRIWQVIASADNYKFPDIIGVCEIENQNVLEDIINTTPLSTIGYKYYYHETQDRRGIDVAFLYKEESFKVLETNAISIFFESDPSYHSRDIIYVKGIAKDFGDTLHFFVNHWPSRYSGYAQSNILRNTSAKTLKHKTDSIFNTNSNSKIICIGDFNDTPFDESVNVYLGALTNYDTIIPKNLYNLAYYMQKEKKMWTYKYQGSYDILDQIIVSSGLLNGDGIVCSKDDAETIIRDFLVEYEADGPKPKRTYIGMKYNDGFSDHLPVKLVLHNNY